MNDTNKGDYTQLVGNVTRDPQTTDTKIGPVLKFGLAVKRGYDQGDVQFVDVAVFNEGLRARAQHEIYKGAQGVAVEGWLKERDYDGKTYFDLVADRVGLVEWFAATRKGQSAPVAVEPAGEFADV